MCEKEKVCWRVSKQKAVIPEVRLLTKAANIAVHPSGIQAVNILQFAVAKRDCKRSLFA
jgi:hypothetical protein